MFIYAISIPPPQVDDLVIGTVINKQGETFTLDLRAPFPASLSALAFEGATRRNRPNLNIGDAVYARVISANRDLDPEVSCVDATGRAAGFGQLKEGLLSQCSTGLARR
jgi:exosome complex component RRP40